MARVVVIGPLAGLEWLGAQHDLRPRRPDELGAEDLVLIHAPQDQGEGLAACQQVLARPQGPPVVLLSSADDELTVCVALSLGATDVIALPRSERELQLRLQAILRRTRPAAAGTHLVTLGRASLDRERRLLLHPGGEIPLTERESQLLLLLMSTPGRWHRRDALLQALWGGEVRPSALQSTLTRLRPRIEQALHIEVRRGLGVRAREASRD